MVIVKVMIALYLYWKYCRDVIVSPWHFKERGVITERHVLEALFTNVKEEP